MTRVLVTDGSQRSALAIARSLTTAGYQVIVGSRTGRSLAGASRGCREVQLADPIATPDLFGRDLGRVIEAESVDALIPVTEASLLVALPLRFDRNGVTVPFVSAERFDRVCDKSAVFDTARALGIAVPEERILGERPADLESAIEGLSFPVVVKPARSIASGASGRAALRVSHAADLPALVRVVKTVPDLAFPLHLQERIEGPGVGVFFLLREGKPLAQFAHRRIREKPPSGGVSVYREGVVVDPGLEARSLELLAAFEWEGVAMVEYKIARDGTPYLMEINGRFWGSLQLAIDSGVDFPRLLMDSALGRPFEPATTYRVGVRSRWFWGDVDQLIQRLRHSRLRLDVAPGYPGRLAALGEFLIAFVGSRAEVARVRDPRPIMRETVQWFADILPRSRRHTAAAK